MEEEIRNQDKKEVKPEEVKKTDRPSFLKEAREIAERNEALVKRMEDLVARNEELAAFNRLGGKTGNPEPEKKDEEATPEKLNKELEKIGW